MRIVTAVIAVVLALVGLAEAQVTLPTAVDVSNVESLVGIVLVGLFVVWGARKLIKMTNRS